MFDTLEAQVHAAVQWLRLAVETLGALVIGLGLLVAMWGLARHALHSRGRSFNRVRLDLARYLTLALELQLAADILGTAVAPSWDGIGKLAAIAIIRTVLNYFLEREVQQQLGPDQSGPPQSP